ncbi:tetratricopeptide repeat protein [Reinekea marina]|uniref:Tetratricopeptide repeat protein n=1 Tax=Reinekea marina TaxID=1310421 RepID=A0ABV7WTH0_9GAMM|nr:tetratricopeptide repeat protein [Reinekea marina]MDN3648864.1 tetratricopeptide repeat protein [Reinekea marina]
MPYTHLLKRFSSFLAAALLLACSTTATQDEGNANLKDSAESESKILKANNPKPLTGQTFFELLLAEIAINRGDLGSAASIYRLISEHESDPSVFERAVALNQSIGHYESVRLLGIQWSTIEPEAAGPWQSLSIATLNLGDYEAAKGHIEQWLTIDANANVNLALPHSSQLQADQTNELISLFESLLKTYPASHSLQFSLARLYFLKDDIAQSEAYVEQAIQLEPALTYHLFKYQVLIKTEQIKQATKLIKALVKRHPTDVEVAVSYARHLYRYDRANVSELQVLHTRFSNEPIIARTYARVAFEQNDLDTAAAIFQHLLEQGFVDEGHYFLGLIHLENNQPSIAASHFEQVQAPPYLASALAEWAQLGREEDRNLLFMALAQAKEKDAGQETLYWKIEAGYEQQLGHLDRAIKVYTQALEESPNNTDLLYEQALLFASIENFAGLEENLEKVLTLDPANVNAMNALGYTWADLNKNLPQAQRYIDKALKEQPNNPAFMDSKGWLLYRLGEPKKALDWLTKAYQQLKIDEVAAHIAEVYWYINDQEQAQHYYQRVVELNPESPFLERLDKLFNE